MGHESFERDTPLQGSSNRTLGFVFGVVFFIIGALPLAFGATARWWSVVVGGLFVALGLFAPRFLAPLNRLWTRFGLLLHRIVSPVVLGIMFYLVVTPIGILMRMFGKDPLRLRFDTDAKSYWIERTPPGPSPQSLSDQF